MNNFLRFFRANKPNFTLIVVVSCLSFPVHASPWQSPDYILNSFNKIALGGSQLKKWRQPIYYQIAHHVDDIELHEKLVALHLEQLQLYIELPILPANSEHKANMTIVLTTEEKLNSDVGYYFKLTDTNKINEIIKNKIGVTSIRSNREGYIEESVIVIPTDRARAYGRLLTSFAEMLTRGIGMQNHSNEVSPSIFNGDSVNGELTGLDSVMIKLLYDQRIQPGMNEKGIQALGKSILNEKKYKKFINEADVQVRQCGLNSLLN